MANRLFVVFFLQTCLYHVVRPSSYVTFTTTRRPQQINQLDIRSLYPELQSRTGFTGYVPITEPASRLLDQVIPSQIVSSSPISRSMGSILPNPGLSNYQTSSQWTKTPEFGTGGFIRGIFQAADNNKRLTSPISRPACGVSESCGSNFHESIGSNDSGRGFSGLSSGYDESIGYCGLGCNGELASSKPQSKSNFGKPFSNYDRLTSSQNRLSSSISESVSCKSRLDSNLSGSCFHNGGSISSYSRLGSNDESTSRNTLTGCNFCRPYSNYDVSTSSNSGLGCNVGESVSSKTRSYSNVVSESAFNKDRSGSNFGDSFCSYDGLGNNRELVPSSNFGSLTKHHHGSTNSNESTDGSGRMGSYGSSDQGAVGVAGELPVVGRTTVVGRVPVTGGVKFNGFIPAAGRVTIGGSCYCGPPFAF